MRYYYLKEHDFYTDNPRIINWYGTINPADITRERAKYLPRRVLLSVAENPHMIFPTIITKPFFLVNEMIRDVIKMYDDTIFFKQIVLLDAVNGKAELYFLPILERAECLTDESRKMLDMGRLTEVVINGSQITDKPLFWIRGNATHILVRLDLIESILKRDSRGIDVKPANISFGEGGY